MRFGRAHAPFFASWQFSCALTAILFSMILLAAPLAAQTASGTVQGIVADEQTGGIAGARITLRPASAGTSGDVWETVSDAQGRFVFGPTVFGNYVITVDKQGFAPNKQTFVNDAATTELRLILTPATIQAAVTVSDSGAEDAALEETLGLPATLRETPRSVTVINAERIRTQNFRQVPEVLSYVPNTAVNSYRSGGYHFYSRGYRMSPEDTRVDGFAGINTGGGFGASLFGVEQVVLLRGPASLLYGSTSAPGGLINLVTKKPQETRVTQIDLRGGGFAGNGVSLDERFSGGVDIDSTGAVTKNGQLLYRALFTLENMNYFTNGTLDRNRYASGALTYKFDKEGRYSVTPLAYYTRFNRPAGGGIVISPSTSLATNDGNSGPINTSDISRPDVNLSAGGRVDETFMTGFDARALVTERLRFNAAYRYVDFEYFINQFAPQVTSATQITQLRTQQTVARIQSKSDNYQRNHSLDLNGSYEMRPASGWRNTTQIGFYRRALTTRSTIATGTIPAARAPINIYTGVTTSALTDNYPTLAWAAPAETTYLNGYLQNRTAFANNRINLAVGLGYGRNTVNGSERKGAFIPNVGLVVNAHARLSFYASYAQSFNPNDATLQDSGGNVNTFAPTKGKNYETGAKFDFWQRRVETTLSLFHNTIDNALVQSGATDFNPNGVRYYIAAGTRRSRGVELTQEVRPRPFWSITASVSYLDAIYTGAAPASARTTAAIPGSRAEKSPRWSANLWQRYDRNEGRLKGFGAGLGLIWQDKRLGSNGARTFAAPDPLVLPAFTRVDAALFYRFTPRTEVGFNFDNLFDRLIFVNASIGSAIEIAAPRRVSFRLSHRF